MSLNDINKSVPKNSYKQKKDRLDRLIGLLKSKEVWTTQGLSEELRVSHRTLMRDLGELQELGIPIESERGPGGGVRINQRYGLSKLELGNTEIIELLLALATIEKLKSPVFLQNLKSIRDKIARAFPSDQRRRIQDLRSRIYIGDSASNQILSTYETPKKTITNRVHESFFAQTSIKITYTSEKKETLERQIEPHYLVLIWPVWYIAAWDHLRGAIRFFRLDRISRIRLTQQPFRLHHRSSFEEQLKIFSESI